MHETIRQPHRPGSAAAPGRRPPRHGARGARSCPADRLFAGLRPPRLTARQRAKLLTLLLKGARAHGFSTDLWTLPRITTVITRTFGVTYHPAHVWRILRGEGWSCQKPERQARERDEAAVQRWRTERWPHIKKRSPRSRAWR